jgi:hypothetical protein
LDLDPCLLALALTQQRRQEIYRAFVEQGVREHELKLIRGAVQRNQLTGSESFILHVERVTGERILHRSRGRPAANH